MTVLRIGWLVREGLTAVLRPGRVMARIPAAGRLPYGWLLVLLATWGMVYAFLHFRAMEGVWPTVRWSWSWHHAGLWRVLTFVGGSVVNWLMAAVALSTLSWWRRWPLSVAQCDIAAFYLWCVWALMPLVDLIHLFGVPTRVIFLPLMIRESPLALIAHASWWFAFPVLAVELCVLFRSRFRLPVLGAVGIGLGLLAAGRLVFETLPVWTAPRLAAQGWLINEWALNTLHALLGIAQWGCVRLWMGGQRRWPVIGAGSVATAVGWAAFVVW